MEALEEVTTVPALARAGGDPSTCWKLLRGVEMVIDSASALPRFPETAHQVWNRPFMRIVMREVTKVTRDCAGHFSAGVISKRW